MKKNDGITLIALVVTIIVLIILAGVTFNLIIGNNGIITRTKEAREEYIISSIQERLDLIEANAYINKQRKINLEEYFEILEEQKILPYEVTNIEKKSDTIGVVEVDGKYSFVIRKENDITIEYEGEIDKIDTREPNIKITLAGENRQNEVPIRIEATITNNNEPIKNAKWVFNNESGEIGIDETTYTEDLKDTNKIEIEINEMDTYYLHVLTKDRFGIEKETIKGPIIVREEKHVHVGSSSAGGECYENEPITVNDTCVATWFRGFEPSYGCWTCGVKGEDKTTWTHSSCGLGVATYITWSCGHTYNKNAPAGGGTTFTHSYTKKEYQLNCGLEEKVYYYVTWE